MQRQQVNRPGKLGAPVVFEQGLVAPHATALAAREHEAE
jgi:hypothetical protein